MDAKVNFSSSLYGVRFWEVEVMVNGGLHHIDVGLADMKRRGVTKNANGHKKVAAWLNSPQGKIYLADRLATKK